MRNENFFAHFLFCVRFLQILNLQTDFRPCEESVRDNTQCFELKSKERKITKSLKGSLQCKMYLNNFFKKHQF